ncbi:MAG: hypothetical protein JO048_09400 [Methylobacteriaceae bacterium]|nr:hypothetical protein [Methylobacteriaceae bacterium]
MMSFPRLAALPLALLLLAPAPGAAESARSLPAPLGTTELMVSDRASGLGLSGFDPVTFQVDGVPRPGRPERELVWGGVAWRFAGNANLEAFRRDPAGFAPRLGGYDATAMADGRLVAGDPRFFRVEEGRLYVFRDEAARDRFAAEPGLGAAAEARWPAVRDGLVRF